MSEQNEILLQIRAKTDKATAEIRQLKAQLDKLSASTNKSNGSFKGQEKALASLNAKTASLTRTLSGLATAYLSIAGAKAFIASMAEIEEGFVGIAKTTSASTEEMALFTEGLYDMTSELSGISLAELQKITEGAGQLGVATEDILTFTKSIAKITVATNMTAEDASKDFAVIANVFGEPVENIEKLGSAVNELSATTAGTVGQIIDGTKRLAGVGKTFGLASYEVMAFNATLADAGVQTEIGSTGLMQLFQRMQTETEAFAKASGVSIDEFANTMKNDPIEAVQLFANKIKEMDDSGESSAQMLKDLGLNGAGASQVVLALGLNTEKLTENLKTANDAYRDGTSVQVEYEKASNTINSKMKNVENAFVRLGKELMVTLQPAVKNVLDSMIEFIDSIDSVAIGEMAQDVVDAGKAVTGFVAENKVLIKTVLELGVAFIALNKAQGVLFNVLGAGGLKLISSVNGSGVKLTKTLGILTKRVVAFGKSLLLLATANPVIAGIVAVLGVTLYAYNSYNESIEKSKEIQKGYTKAISETSSVFSEYEKHLDSSNKLVFESVDAQNEYLYSINDAIEANDKMIKSLLDDGYEEHKTEIVALSKQNLVLRDTAIKVSEVTEDEIKKRQELVEAIKKEADSKLKLSKKEQEFVDKANENARKRLTKETQTLEVMRIENTKLYADLESLERELSAIRTKYSNQRYDIDKKWNDKLIEIDRSTMTEREKNLDDLARKEAEHELYKYELSKGNLEQAEKHFTAYTGLAEDYYKTEIEKVSGNSVLKKKKLDEYQAYIVGANTEENAMLDVKEAKEIAIHNQKIDMKIIEIESLKTEIKLQMASVDAMNNLANTGKKVKFKADLEPFKKLIVEADGQLQALTDQKREAKITLDADTANANRKFNEIQELGSKDVTTKQYADNTNALGTIGETARKASEQKAIIYTYADTTNADGSIDRVVTEVSGEKHYLHVGADTTDATISLDQQMMNINTASGYVSIDVDTFPATRTVEELGNIINSKTGTMTVLADTAPVSQSVDTEVANIEAKNPSLNVGFRKGDSTEIDRKVDDLKQPITSDIRLEANKEVVKQTKQVKDDIIEPVTAKLFMKFDSHSVNSAYIVKNQLAGDIRALFNIVFNPHSTNSAYKLKSQLSSPTYSMFGFAFDSNSVNQAYLIRNQLSQPIYTMQYIQTEYSNSNGGLAGTGIQKFKVGGEVDGIQRFAVGGFPIRSGALGGYGGGDRIKSLLEAGEFIQRKEAVAKYGVGFMHLLNQMKLPADKVRSLVGSSVGVNKYRNGGEVARFATGGAVSSNGSGEMRQINLNIGGETYKMMSDVEVANALERHLGVTGGR